MCCLLFNRNPTGIKVLPTHITCTCATDLTGKSKQKIQIKEFNPATSLEFLPEASQQNNKAAQSSCSHKPVWPQALTSVEFGLGLKYVLCENGALSFQ